MREIRSQFENAGEGASGVGNLRASPDLLAQRPERQLARRGTQRLGGACVGRRAADGARAQEDAGCGAGAVEESPRRNALAEVLVFDLSVKRVPRL